MLTIQPELSATRDWSVMNRLCLALEEVALNLDDLLETGDDLAVSYYGDRITILEICHLMMLADACLLFYAMFHVKP